MAILNEDEIFDDEIHSTVVVTIDGTETDRWDAEDEHAADITDVFDFVARMSKDDFENLQELLREHFKYYQI